LSRIQTLLKDPHGDTKTPGLGEQQPETGSIFLGLFASQGLRGRSSQGLSIRGGCVCRCRLERAADRHRLEDIVGLDRSLSLTRRQRELSAYLETREADGLPPPTLDELCRAMGVTSRGSMHKHVQGLVDAGLVEPMDGRHRGVRLRPRPQPASPGTLPLLGTIAAGRPIEALENPEQVEVPARLRGRGPSFVLQVRGDSMVEEGILDGDWVVIEARDQARDGEVVVALIDDAEATLKRIEQRPGRVVLHPANRAMKALEYPPDRVRVQGVLVGQMRAYGR
jgi:repressor LexA